MPPDSLDMNNYSKLYKTYFTTQAWKDMRDKILELDAHSCRKCGYEEDLQVHHKNYKRLGCEHEEDLITLCRGCHKKRH